jgi:uncharacterized membrane protein
MEKQPPSTDPTNYDPNMFWEGFYYLSFFIFFIIFLIPYAPKTITFDGNYKIAMIPFGIAGVLTGRVAFLLTRNMPSWVKVALMAVVYACLLYYLFTNVGRFTVPDLK